MIWTEEVKGQDADIHGQTLLFWFQHLHVTVNFGPHTSTRGSEPDELTCGSGDEDEYSEPDEDDGEAGSAFT